MGAGASSWSKNSQSDSSGMIGTSKCFAMHDITKRVPMWSPRVRKLWTTATTSWPGSALE